MTTINTTKILRKYLRDALIEGEQNYLNGDGIMTLELHSPNGNKVYGNFMNAKQHAPMLTKQYDNWSDDCYGQTLSFEEAVEVVRDERTYQKAKWNDQAQSLPGFLLILQKEINEAVEGWMKNKEGRDSPLHEVVQVAATAIACIERYGATGITINTNDVPIPYKSVP